MAVPLWHRSMLRSPGSSAPPLSSLRPVRATHPFVRLPADLRIAFPPATLSRPHVLELCAAALALFLLAVFQLDPVVRWLWPIPVVLFVVYPYLKRLTWLRHVRWARPWGSPRWAPGRRYRRAPVFAWTLGGAVALWVAGFHPLYPVFDGEHDRGKSALGAVRFGGRGVFAARARCISGRWRCWTPSAGARRRLLYWLGIVAGGAARLDTRSFGREPAGSTPVLTVNGVISIVFLAFVLADALAR